MTAVTFTETTDPIRGRTFVYSDGRSAITFHAGIPGIEVHSPTPLYGDTQPSYPCDYVGQCWTDGSSLAGRALVRRWAESDHDNEVIRAELESWWAQQFGERAA